MPTHVAMFVWEWAVAGLGAGAQGRVDVGLVHIEAEETQMKPTHISILAIVLVLMAPARALYAQTAVGTAFTYQGQLKQAGEPVEDTADFEFTLWDAAFGGNPVGDPNGVSADNLTVDNGLFTVVLDFGDNIFVGEARWLEIAVRVPAGGGAFTTLAPRQELTPAPYALALPGVWTQPNTTSPNVIAGHADNTVTPGAIGGHYQRRRGPDQRRPRRL